MNDIQNTGIIDALEKCDNQCPQMQGAIHHDHPWSLILGIPGSGIPNDFFRHFLFTTFETCHSADVLGSNGRRRLLFNPVLLKFLWINQVFCDFFRRSYLRINRITDADGGFFRQNSQLEYHPHYQLKGPAYRRRKRHNLYSTRG